MIEQVKSESGSKFSGFEHQISELYLSLGIKDSQISQLERKIVCHESVLDELKIENLQLIERLGINFIINFVLYSLIMNHNEIYFRNL